MDQHEPIAFSNDLHKLVSETRNINKSTDKKKCMISNDRHKIFVPSCEREKKIRLII